MKGSHLKKPWLTSFEEAKEIVKSFNIKTYSEYLDWSSRPRELPVNPRITYKDHGWKGTRDFFGTSRPTISELKKILKENGIKNHTDYITWGERKKFNLPANVAFAYKEFGFTSIPELIGKEGPRSYAEQKKWIKDNLTLNSSHDFAKWLEETKEDRPSFISTRPDRKFGNKGTKEWISWESFLN